MEHHGGAEEGGKPAVGVEQSLLSLLVRASSVLLGNGSQMLVNLLL